MKKKNKNNVFKYTYFCFFILCLELDCFNTNFSFQSTLLTIFYLNVLILWLITSFFYINSYLYYVNLLNNIYLSNTDI